MTIQGGAKNAEGRRARGRAPGPFVVSLAIHVLVLIAFVGVLRHHVPVGWLLQDQGDEGPRESVRFVTLTPEGASAGREAAAPQYGGGAAQPPLVAPREIPIGLPPVASAASAYEPGIAGDVRGAHGPARGMKPAYSDRRVWAPPSPVAPAPKTEAERIDSAVVAMITRHRDSLEALGTPRDPADWTVERNGLRWGVDREFIRLGKVSLPTALLALLPINVQANPITGERERQYNMMNLEIREQAARAMNEAEFKEAVRRIRERKDRERNERTVAEEENDQRLGPVQGQGLTPR